MIIHVLLNRIYGISTGWLYVRSIIVGRRYFDAGAPIDGTVTK